MKQLLVFLLLACIGAFAYDRYQTHLASLPVPSAEPERVSDESISSTPEWRPPPREDARKTEPSVSGCDGRTHCSQMSSCNDAKTQMRCPNAAMDGDHDGIPCERQWCS